MPRHRDRNRYRHQNKEDSCCCELLMLFFFFYIQDGAWNPKCTYFFNTYMFSSYMVLFMTRKFSQSAIEQIEYNRCVQILVLGVILPILLT